jgi:Domain of unknown function (DUF3291)
MLGGWSRRWTIRKLRSSWRNWHPLMRWRLQSESGNATDIAYNVDPFVIVNMSVWESIETLRDFASRSDHIRVFRDRAKWFEKAEKTILLLMVGSTGVICIKNGAKFAFSRNCAFQRT